MTVTNQNIIVNMGGGSKFGGRHQRHYPIWKDENGVEYVSINGHSWVKLSDQDFVNAPREVVTR
jgi:hypothetical protein